MQIGSTIYNCPRCEDLLIRSTHKKPFAVTVLYTCANIDCDYRSEVIIQSGNYRGVKGEELSPEMKRILGSVYVSKKRN